MLLAASVLQFWNKYEAKLETSKSQSERIGQWATPQTIADMAELSEVSRL